MMLHLTPEQKALGLMTAISMAGLYGGPAFFRWASTRPSWRWRFGPNGKNSKAGGVRIGNLWIPDEARLRHSHILGATGSGKTVLMEQLIFRDLERGLGALIIDPKGDRDFYLRLTKFMKRIGRESDLKLLSATHEKESFRWNPCRVGNASELQNKFFGSAIYSEPHYAKACELALLRVFNQLKETHPNQTTLSDVVVVLNELSRGGKDETVAGLFLDLKNLEQSGWGRLLGSQSWARPEVSLLDVVRKSEVLFVDLPTESQATQSGRIGRLLLQEIILISGLRKQYPHLRTGRPFSVFVDEFDAFAFPAFTTFLNKGRSSEFMIHISHQTLSDLERVSPTFLGQILGNVNVRFTHRVDHPDDAETLARMSGTHSVVKTTYQTQDGQSTGLSSNREVQEFRVSPDSLKELSVGECVLTIKSPRVLKKFRVPFGTSSQDPLLEFPESREPLGLSTPVEIAHTKDARPKRMDERMSALIEQNNRPKGDSK